MINIWIIFLTQYPLKNDILFKISPFNQKVQDLIFFSKIFCPAMNEMDF
jgi:hypothetical protein